MIELHPSADPIESERCPECGTPGRPIFQAGSLQFWTCPLCDETEVGI